MVSNGDSIFTEKLKYCAINDKDGESDAFDHREVDHNAGEMAASEIHLDMEMEPTILLEKTHCKGNPQFNFHKYMMRALEADFKVVGIHMELISISCILFFKLCILASIFLQLVSMEIRGNFLVAERGWMACILLYSICSLHCKKHPDFSSRVIFLFDESLTVLHHRETASACSRYELQYKFDSCVMGKCLFIIPRLVIGVECLFLGTLTSMELVHL
ncbi:MLO-like protein 1 [Linum perenne]